MSEPTKNEAPRRLPLREAREAALAVLAQGRRGAKAEAARAAGRCRDTIYEWLADPAFVEELARRRAGVDEERAKRAEALCAEFSKLDLGLRVTPEERERLDALAPRVGCDREALVVAALWYGVAAFERDLGLARSAPEASRSDTSSR
jgi:hypothetical protein